MTSMESIFSFGLSALSVLPEEQLQEWFDLFRNLDRKHSDEIKQLKAENSIIKEEKTQLDTKVKALTEENEKLKTELAAGSVSVVNNVELLLKGLETRLNANAVKQVTALQQSNATLVEYMNKNFEAHTKTVQDSVAASMEIVKTKAEDSEEKLQALHCMQVLSDSGTVPIAYCTKKRMWNMPPSILEVYLKKKKAGDNVVLPFMYMKKKCAIKDYHSSLVHHVNLWEIRLGTPYFVYVADCKASKRTSFILDEWSIYVENSRRIEITWLDSKRAYEVACFA
ncbi:hypothetical protein FPQ18DRAFT_388000 [Pyronema domesticum]|uniref:Uncharacterized protein n=1 Tax=Pyronema omphalodes (strain CBS 100304) TaxID=1076935 RepID=U4L832_PYROM|nr:hypothetical protein FPQ18DRAFT_388000 [Pyronema domesticum]CCX06299.1 Protein of unknown function [Pyronema omphalodes CBS 100304]